MTENWTTEAKKVTFTFYAKKSEMDLNGPRGHIEDFKETRVKL
jgi:hypothetical protein